MTDLEIIYAEIRKAEVPMSDALAGALERMERDASRFRWLMETGSQVTYTQRRGEDSKHCELHSTESWCRRRTLSDAIDVVMRNGRR